MPLDAPPLRLAPNPSPGGSDGAARSEAIAELNAGLRHHSASDVIVRALDAFPNLALVSSFGAESVALLHLAAMVKRDIPVLFIDTEMLFAETLVYQQDVAERLNLRNVTVVRAQDIAAQDPDATLHQRDPDACCALRKTRPLEAALKGYGGWIPGRKRFQSHSRATLPFIEARWLYICCCISCCWYSCC